MATGASWLLLNRASCLRQSILDPPSPQECARDIGLDKNRVQRARATHLTNRIVVTFERGAQPAIVIVHLGVGRTEFESSEKFALGARPIEIEDEPNHSRNAVRLRQFVIELQCSGGGCFGQTDRFFRGLVGAAVDAHLCVRLSNARPNEGETRITRGRGLVFDQAAAIPVLGELIERVAPPQVELVGLEIVGRTSVYTRALVLRQFRTQGICYAQCDLGLYCKMSIRSRS